MNVLSSSFLPPGCSFEIQLEVLKNDQGVQLPQSSRTRIHSVDDESGRKIEGESLDLETTVGKKGPGLGSSIAPSTFNTQHAGTKEDKGDLSQFLIASQVEQLEFDNTLAWCCGWDKFSRLC
jgi:hypothetical protein